MSRRIALVIVLCLALVPIVRADEEEGRPLVPRPYHHVTIFGGAWLELVDDPEQSFQSQSEWQLSGAYGVGYEYRSSSDMGVCFFYQRAGGEADTKLLGGGVGLHFGNGWWTQVASMWVRREGDSSGRLRFGLNREFRLGKKSRTTITPTLNFDMAEGGFNLVFGLNFGRMFPG